MSGAAAALPFDLRSLDVFLAVCDLGGMAVAARKLGVTQPSVSQTVADLETRLGTILFDRGVRPLSLTQSGVVLRQRASMLMAEAREIEPILHQVGRGRLPFLRLGIVDSLSRTLAGALARFLSDAAVESSLLSGLTSAHATALVTRQLDLLLGAEAVEDMEGLERHLVLEERYVLLLPHGVPVPHDVAALAALGAERPFVRFSARSRSGMEIERHLRRLRMQFDRRQEFDTPFGVTAAVAAGLGWAITTPLCMREAAVPADGIGCHPLPGPALTRKLVLVARQKELGALPAQMAAMCREVLAGMGFKAPAPG